MKLPDVPGWLRAGSALSGLKLFCLALLSILVLATGCSGPGQTQPAHLPLNPAEQARALALYDEAWAIVRQEYVDPSFNGQDWAKWRHHFRDKIRDYDDAYVAIGTMVASLNDEYTRFLSPKDMKEQTMSIDSRLFGVGIQISVKDSKLSVVSVLDDTPAQKAGLQSLDHITHINGKDTAGITVEEAADRIRGPKGTQVRLTIRRGSDVLDKTLTRDEIHLKSVFTKEMKDRRIGYVRISTFISDSLLMEMYEIMRQMKNKEALIIDLRGNYGGLFSNSVEIADMFLDSGDIVSVVNRNHDERVYAAHPGALFRKPMVVLIDGASASASEILSGALKDHDRATLIGTQSFGKGLVQKINNLPHGAGMNITISKYLTPDGTDINKKGIAPDIEVRFKPEDLEAKRDPQLDRAVDFLQKKLAS